MNIDEYGEVINGEMTTCSIVGLLAGRNTVIIGWSDGAGTHFDILFSARPLQTNHLQGGVRGVTDLFVSIMRVGCFGFEIGKESHFSYYAEKLNVEGGVTAERLSELINPIRMALKEE